MALAIPKEPKVYTTKYANYKGVDYTNDPSNVWYRRSPNGVNMLPNLDGKPYKRNGWKVEATAEDFKTESGINEPVTPKKVYYFELGGKDYMAIFNNLGLFFYDGTLSFVSSYTDTSGSPQTFPPEVTVVTDPTQDPPTTDDIRIPADANRAFFFEGQGTAGFYFFAGKTLFMFDGKDVYEVAPKIPLVLIGTTSEGVGTYNEDINLLTRARTVSYTTDGSIFKFKIPEFYDDSEFNPYVEVMNDGEWEILDSGWDLTTNVGYITFTTPPAGDGSEDGMRFTYVPDGSFDVQLNSGVISDTMKLRVERAWGADFYVEKRQRKTTNYLGNEVLTTTYNIVFPNGEIGQEPFQGKNYYSFTGDSCTVHSPSKNADGTSAFTVQYVDGNGVWQTYSDATHYELNENAYSGVVGITPREEMYVSGDEGSETISSVDLSAYEDPFFNDFYESGSFHPIHYGLVEEDSGWLQQETIVNSRDGKETYVYRKYCHAIYTNEVREYTLRVMYDELIFTSSDVTLGNDSTAFFATTRASIFGNGIINQVFLTASTAQNYSTRVWYSGATDPTYFPDTNYIEVGATDKQIMGLIPIGDYLGIIKRGGGTETSIYLAYPTSFDDQTTYAVKQSVNGIGAVASGAFNILNDEPLYLSAEGVMGVEPRDDDDRRIRNRSYYVNKKLKEETQLKNAFSFVYDNMYWLAVGGRCYVLDGSQKSSWENEKTNLQYEAYYLENVPAQCFAKYGGSLWFTDYQGNLCRFKKEGEQFQFVDDYNLSETVSAVADAPPVDNEYEISSFEEYEPKLNDIIQDSSTNKYYTVMEVGEETITVSGGVSIYASWGTIADDDGSAHYLKNLMKKGSLVALLPIGKPSSVEVTIIADGNRRFYIGGIESQSFILPLHKYTKKKVKKYKRLSILCENNEYNEGFGIDQIIKSYTVGNYAKK